jgi:hypothetical protein
MRKKDESDNFSPLNKNAQAALNHKIQTKDIPEYKLQV